MTSNLFGGIQISETTQFDTHLFVLIVPAFFMLLTFALRNAIRNSSLKTKNFLSVMSGSALLTTFVLVFATFFVEKSYAVGFANSFGFIHSLDLLLTLVVGVLLLLKLPGTAKRLAPMAIVFALTRIINNPGQNLSYFELTNAICLLVVPVFAAFLSRESISLLAHGVTSAVTAALLVYIAAVNAWAGTSFSMINYDALSRNVFYQYISDANVQVFAFIILTLLAQTIAWLIIRYEHHTHFYASSSVSWWSSLLYEAKRKHSYRAFFIKLVARMRYELELDVKAPEGFDLQINTLEDEIASESVDLATVSELLVAYDLDSEIFPTATIRTITSIGTRAPTSKFFTLS